MDLINIECVINNLFFKCNNKLGVYKDQGLNLDTAFLPDFTWASL